MSERELTQAQLDRQDEVDNACFNFILEMSGEKSADDGGKVEWDMETIQAIREAVQEVIVDTLHLMTEMEFYPYTSEDEDTDEEEGLNPATAEFMGRIDTQNIAEMVLGALFEHNIPQTMDNADTVWEGICDNISSDIDNCIEHKLESGQLTEISTEQLQSESDKVYAWLKTTSEPFDNWEYDGSKLTVFNGTDKPEVYTRDFLAKQIPDLNQGGAK